MPCGASIGQLFQPKSPVRAQMSREQLGAQPYMSDSPAIATAQIHCAATGEPLRKSES